MHVYAILFSYSENVQFFSLQICAEVLLFSSLLKIKLESFDFFLDCDQHLRTSERETFNLFAEFLSIFFKKMNQINRDFFLPVQS